MENFINIINHPFSWGLIFGFVLLIINWIIHRKEIKRYRTENSELKIHLNTQLKITAAGNEELQSQLNEMTKQNENLRINIQTLQQKPKKVEHRRLEVMEMTVTSMREQAPGFAQAWEKAIRQSEDDMKAAESGFTKLLRRVVPTFRSTSAKDTKLIEADVSNNSD